MAFKGFKYRIYPDGEQVHQLACTFGCVRFVYNHCLTRQEETHTSGGEYIRRSAMNNYCNQSMKDEYPFLRDVDKFALTNAIYHLADAYERMFNGLGKHPKYKSKHKSKKSYTTNFTNNNIETGDTWIKLPKLGKVKAVIHRDPPEGWSVKAATVSQECDGTYYCSVLYEYEEAIVPVLCPELNAAGLDYKSDGLYEDSDGNVCGSPKYYRRAQKRLARAQRSLSRKQCYTESSPESNNHKKQKIKVTKIHRHIANERKDRCHKKSTVIANQYDLVAVEDLDMKAMSNKGFGNGKATLDNGYGMFLKFLEYKLHDRGKVFIRVSRWYPSSRICSACGYRNPAMKDLSVRTWTCPCCGAEHDRDHNAAVNIRNEGIRLYKEMTA